MAATVPKIDSSIATITTLQQPIANAQPPSSIIEADRKTYSDTDKKIVAVCPPRQIRQRLFRDIHETEMPSEVRYAMRKQQEEITNSMVSCSASVITPEVAPFIEFQQAVLKGQVDIAQKYILKHKNAIKEKDSAGNTPLCIAAREGHLNMCQMLLEAGANPITKGEYSRNALHNAVEGGHEEIVQLFVTASQLGLIYNKTLTNAEDDCCYTPLLLAARSKYHQICKILLKAGANPLLKVPYKAPFKIANETNSGYTALHLAVLSYCEKTVKVFSVFTELLNSKLSDGTTPLILAAKLGIIHQCRVLLAEKADALATDDEGVNAMHAAAKAGSSEVIQLLIVHKQLINSKNKQGETPLMLAATNRFSKGLNCCEALLKAGAELLAENETGENAMHYSVSQGRINIIKLLISKEKRLDNEKRLVNLADKNGITPLMLAAECTNSAAAEAFEILWNAGAHPFAVDCEGWNAMHIAAYSGNLKVVEMLSACKQLIDSEIKQKAQCNMPSVLVSERSMNVNKLINDSFEETPLHLAAEKGHLEVCKALLKVGANPIATNNKGWNAMHFAASNGKVEIIEMLLAYKQLIDSKGDNELTPLLLAARAGQLKVCEVLLKAGANPFATHKDGWNAMHFAVSKGNTNLVKMLLKHQQLIDVKTGDGATPLNLTVSRYHPGPVPKEYLDVCKTLLEAGADQGATGKNGWTVMHMAAFTGKIEFVNMFLAYDHLINSSGSDIERVTPLMLAAGQGHVEVCKVLLKAGANPCATSKAGNNALSFARTMMKDEVVHLLASAQPVIDSKNKEGELHRSAQQNKKSERCSRLGCTIS